MKLLRCKLRGRSENDTPRWFMQVVWSDEGPYAVICDINGDLKIYHLSLVMIDPQELTSQ